MKKALITGITGFAGSHLAELLLKEGLAVYGTTRPRSKTDNIDGIKGRLNLYDADILDSHSLSSIIVKIKPDYIFHLAAQSFVQTSWASPATTIEINVIGSVHLFEAVRRAEINPVIQIACSSEEYGLVYPNEIPVKEENPLRPQSPYAVSKVAMDYLGYQYFQSYKMKIIRTRGFNHSVSPWTPIIVRDEETKMIDIKYVCEVRKAREKTKEELWDLSKENIQIWANNKFTKVYHLFAHRLNGNRLLRVIGRGGIAEVTDNHSIIGESLEEVNTGELNKGDRIKIVDLPETPSLTKIDNNLAWLYGFFVAEGDISERRRLRFSNKDEKILKKCQQLILTYFAKNSRIQDSPDAKKLEVYEAHDLCQYFYKEFYAKDGNKRIPKIILNASVQAQRAFLEGYNLGDGLLKGYGNYQFKNFKTKSRILALGLCYLIKNVLGQRITLSYEDRNSGYFNLNLNSPSFKKTGQHLVKSNNEIIKIQEVPFKDFVYDFETEEHYFHGGVGGILLHNTGPRRGEVFVTSNFARQIAEIEKGKKEPVIEVGNLGAKRDWTDARDMVHAYLLAVQKGKPGEVYNICSEKTVKVGDMLDLLLGMSKVKVKVRQDPSRLRPSDVPILLGDCTKFRKATGWKPRIPFEKTMGDLLNYWRERV